MTEPRTAHTAMNHHPVQGTPETCEHMEHYLLEESGEALYVLSLRCSAGSQRLALDDLEFQIEEAVTADELAQGIFVLTGGVLGVTASCGESACFFFHYSPSLPGKIGLEFKAQNTGSTDSEVPRLTWFDDTGACTTPTRQGPART